MISHSLSFPLSRVWHWHHQQVRVLDLRHIPPSLPWVSVFHDIMHMDKWSSIGHHKSCWSTPNSISNWVIDSSHHWEIWLNTCCHSTAVVTKRREEFCEWRYLSPLDMQLNSNGYHMNHPWFTFYKWKIQLCKEVSSLSSQVWNMSPMRVCCLENQDYNSWVLD